MSVSWAADPDSKRACGHRRCKRTSRAGGILMWASPVIIVPGAVIPDLAGPAVAAAFAVFAAGLALACWPHPPSAFRDLEALIYATRTPDHVPDSWVKEFLQ